MESLIAVLLLLVGLAAGAAAVNCRERARRPAVAFYLSANDHPTGMMRSARESGMIRQHGPSRQRNSSVVLPDMTVAERVLLRTRVGARSLVAADAQLYAVAAGTRRRLHPTTGAAGPRLDWP